MQGVKSTRKHDLVVIYVETNGLGGGGGGLMRGRKIPQQDFALKCRGRLMYEGGGGGGGGGICRTLR